MTPEEITKLAKSLCATSNPTQDDVWLIEDIIEGILRTHCIVSKEKVADEYETSKHYFEATDSSNPTQKQYFYGRMTVFESLFDTETFKKQ